MGSVGVEDGGAGVEAFLQRCAPSGDAAYAELRAVLERLHDRRDARVFLAALRRRRQQQQSDKDDFFRRFGFRIQELLLHDNPAATAASAFLSVQSPPAGI